MFDEHEESLEDWEDERRIGTIPLCADDDYDFIKVDVLNEMYRKSYAIFNELRSKCQLCDVALVVQNKKLSAHKVVLAGTIPYFRGMFTLDLMEANMKEIRIEDMDYDTVEQLLSFAYTGEIRISTSNVQSLMLGANFFQLQEVVQHCGQFLITRLDSSNALSIREFCKLMSVDEKIVQLATSFVLKHFYLISQSEDFRRMTLEEVVRLLANDNLYADSEEQIFTAAMSWLQENESRHRHAARILQSVRLPLLGVNFLSKTVQAHPILKRDIPCRDLIDEAKDYHLLPENRASFKSFRCIPRNCISVPGLIVAIGGLIHQAQSKSSVEVYNPMTKKWTPIEGMVTLRTRVGVAVYQRQVYAIGGFNGQDRMDLVERFDYDTKKWTTMAPLCEKRSALAAAFVGDQLYVCGGYNGSESLDSVEIYNMYRNKWETGPTMECQRSASGVTVLDKYIYVCGGHDGMQIFKSAERLDTETGQWEMIPDMLQSRCRFGAATYKGKIYVAGGYDGNSFLRAVERYDPVEMTWSQVAPMNMRRSRVSLVATIDGLFAVAGFDGDNNLCSMEQYDEEADAWNVVTPLLCHEGGVGVAVIPMPVHMFS